MKIFRQQVALNDRQVIELPWGHTILSAAPARDFTDGYIDIWFTVPDKQGKTVIGHKGEGAVKTVVTVPDTERILVHIAGTGHPIDDDIDVDEFVDTCVMPSGLVWHVFARTAFGEPVGVIR